MATSMTFAFSIFLTLFILVGIRFGQSKIKHEKMKNAKTIEELAGEKPQLISIDYDIDGNQFYEARVKSNPRKIFYLIPPEDPITKRNYDEIINLNMK